MWQRLTITALRRNCGCDRAEDKSLWNQPASAAAFRCLCHHPGRGALRSELLRLIQPVTCQPPVSPSFLVAAAFECNKYFFLNRAIIQYRVWHLILSWSTLSISTQKVKVQVKWNCKANESMFVWCADHRLQRGDLGAVCKNPKDRSREKSLLTQIWC